MTASGDFAALCHRWQIEREEREAKSRWLRRRLAEAGPGVFRRHGVRKVVLFGSVLGGRCRAGSDVDLLVTPLAPAHYWELLHELEEMLGAGVDLYTGSDDPEFVRKVLERGEVIYEV